MIIRRMAQRIAANRRRQRDGGKRYPEKTKTNMRETQRRAEMLPCVCDAISISPERGRERETRIIGMHHHGRKCPCTDIVRADKTEKREGPPRQKMSCTVER